MVASEEYGRYRIIRKLASGGMAEVLLAEVAGPAGFTKRVVLKRILPHLAEQPEFVEMLLSEARLVAGLEHPNVVQIFELGEHDGTWFISMEYIEGLSLRALLKRARRKGERLPVELCARMVALACEGLGYAHAAADPRTGAPLNIIHRDVGPENLLLSFAGALKVVDFGIARAATTPQLTRTGTVKGKLAYMPVEQIRNDGIDLRADVYALGVTLYELLAGRPPFSAPNEIALMYAVLTHEPVCAAFVRDDVPESLWAVIRRALARKSADRYPDCAALRLDLEQEILRLGRPAGAPELAALARRYEQEPERRPPGTVESFTVDDDTTDAPTAVEGAAGLRPPSGPRFAVLIEGGAENVLVRLAVRYGDRELPLAPGDDDPPDEVEALTSRDAQAEAQAVAQVLALGLAYKPLLGRYNAQGDGALDLWARGAALFPAGWEVTLPAARRGTVRAPLSSLAVVEPEGNGFRVSIRLRTGTEEVPAGAVWQAVAQGRRYARLHDRSFAAIPESVRLLRDALAAAGALDGELRLPVGEAGRALALLGAADHVDAPLEVRLLLEG